MTSMAASGLEPASIIVTSPPYNLGVGYRTYKDQLPREEYLHWTNRWIAAAAGVGTSFVGIDPDSEYVDEAVARTAEELKRAGEPFSVGYLRMDRGTQ